MNRGGGTFQTINQVGQSMTMVQAIIATICCLIGTGIAVALIFKKSTMVVTPAQVVSTECRTITTKDGARISCTSGVKYTVNGTEYTGTINEDSLNASRYPGQNINIRVDPNAPQTITPDRPSNQTIGYVLSAVCCCVFVCAWAQVLLVKKVPGSGAGMLALAAFN